VHCSLSLSLPLSLPPSLPLSRSLALFIRMCVCLCVMWWRYGVRRLWVDRIEDCDDATPASHACVSVLCACVWLSSSFFVLFASAFSFLPDRSSFCPFFVRKPLSDVPPPDSSVPLAIRPDIDTIAGSMRANHIRRLSSLKCVWCVCASFPPLCILVS